MILPVNSYSNRQISLLGGKNNGEKKELAYDEDTLLENSFSNRIRIGMDKLTKAFTIYPAKGLAGSRNSNFYEFLTMGTVPYIIGSGTLMAVFNAFNKETPSPLSKKMALGVLFYGIFKSMSKSLVDYPVKYATGIDTQLPYARINYQLQETPDDYNLTSIEYHKVGESVDFTRWDQLYGDPKKGQTLNFRFDKIAKKNGLGENLNDSDQEVKPIYREVLVKSNVARSFSSYMWAATGVALAFQKPWDKYFQSATWKFWKVKEFSHSMKVFGKSFIESAKKLYNGPETATSHLNKHAGKYLLGASAIITALGVLNSIHITNKPPKNNTEKVIDPKKESVVC